MLLWQIRTDAGSSNKSFPGSFRSRKLFSNGQERGGVCDVDHKRKAKTTF